MYSIFSQFEPRKIIGLGWIAFGSREPGVIAAARSNTAGALFAAVKACPLLGSHDCAGSPGLNSARVVCWGCQGLAARRGKLVVLSFLVLEELETETVSGTD